MSRSTRWQLLRYLMPVALVAAALGLLGAQVAGLSLSDLQVHDSHAGADDQSVVSDERIVLHSGTVARYEFGDMERGGHAEKAFVLYNPGPTAVTVSRITTSCECLRVELADRVIGPGESTAGTVVADFRNDPGFVGGLLLRAEGWIDGGEDVPAFVTEFGVSVRRSHTGE